MMNSVCERCQRLLKRDSDVGMVCSFELAMIGSFEGIFCVLCATEALSGQCPSCGNELTRCPRYLAQLVCLNDVEVNAAPRGSRRELR